MPLAAIAGIGAIGSIASGVIGSNAAGHAADTQVAAANHAADLERQSATDALNFNKLQYGNSLNLLSPWYNSGSSAVNRLDELMGLRPNSGLPAGVINPNAPPAPRQTIDGSMVDPSTMDRLQALRGGGRAGGPMPMQATSMVQQSATPGGAAGTAPAPGAPGATPGGTAAMLGGGPEVNPFPKGLGDINAGVPLGDPNPLPNGVGNLQNPPQAANGSPGTVARTDGGGPTPGTGGGAPDPSQPLSLNTNGGTFGSLANGWNQSFKSPTNLTDDPGYNFRLSEGMKALQNSAAAKGGLLTGGTAKALNDYAGGSASQEYGNTYNRALQNYNTNYNTFTNDQTNLFNRLASLSGQGQVSANNLSSAGVSAANNAGYIGINAGAQQAQQTNNAGAANASGYVGSADAIRGAIGGVSNSLSTLAMLRMLQGGGSPNPASGNGAY